MAKTFSETIAEIVAYDPNQAVENVYDYMAEKGSHITRREAAFLVERYKSGAGNSRETSAGEG